MAVRHHRAPSLKVYVRICSRTRHSRPATYVVSLSSRAIFTNVIIEHGADAGPHQQSGIALCGWRRFRLNLILPVLGKG